ncbi:hypothetical protein BASA84_001611 [Batrachochytrium salamandrivorans]|nr:hypothetical protein BASA84_001611 [Batrachochytrium salamandrivorans]
MLSSQNKSISKAAAGSNRSKTASASSAVAPAAQVGKGLAACLQNAFMLKRTIAQHQQQLATQSGKQTDTDTDAVPTSASLFAVSDRRMVAVHMRVRPLSALEKQQDQDQYFQAIYCSPSQTVLYYPAFQIITDASLDIHSFDFDGNYSPEVSNDSVYNGVVAGMMDFVVGENGLASIFAYGQTGSGKTHTMSFLAFRIIQELPFATHSVSILMVEVLGNNIKDLLSDTPGPGVRVLVDDSGNTIVHGGTEAVVNSVDEAHDTIAMGFGSRSTCSTFKNNTSSRSHLICRISLTHRVSGCISGIKLVDLAGSERLGDSKHHSAERIKEGALINSSLMALKECLRKRSGQLSDAKHIPFRNSKLTLMLKDSLNPLSKQPTKTVMIACVAPTIADISHSLNTFRYASTLTCNGSDDTDSQGSHLKPSNNKSSSSATRQSVTTPMAWSVSKLDRWINSKSGGTATLEDLQGSDGNPRLARPGVFVPPAWKFIYDLPSSHWVKRLSPHMLPDAAKALRHAYRCLFVQERAVAPGGPKNTGKTQSILLNDEVQDISDSTSLNQQPIVSSLEARRILAMEKLKAKGNLAREKAAGNINGGVKYGRVASKTTKTTTL